MKKLYLLLILLLVGCTKEVEKENIISEKPIIKEEVVEEYQDDNPIKLGLYLASNNYNNKSIIDKEYYTDFINGIDIGSFEVFFTDDEVINGTSFKNTWNKYYNNYDNINDYKIGYNIKFILNDGTNFSGNIKEPDIFKFSDYFYIYLYDDIHQEDGAFYSHLEEMNDNTLITSIKLFAVGGIDKVENIILTVFTYNDDSDFDSDGNYRGNSHYTIRVKRK